MTDLTHNPDHYPHNDGNADTDLLCRACEMGMPVKRAMPGPPEWWDIDWNPHWGLVWIKNGDECDQTFRHEDIDAKRLTDAEAAAEYWRAICDTEEAMDRQEVMDFIVKRRPERKDNGAIAAQIRGKAREARTWHRFATLPHALEVEA